MTTQADRSRRHVATQPGRPSLLLSSGAAELAAGALSGWVYTFARTQPERARELGIVSTARVRQWHLDLAMLGTATVALAAAVPNAPRPVAAALSIGAWGNAMFFLPLAFKPDLDKHPAFLAAVVTSFVATSIGFSGMAATVFARRRRR